jgi:hypothetical protein
MRQQKKISTTGSGVIEAGLPTPALAKEMIDAITRPIAYRLWEQRPWGENKSPEHYWYMAQQEYKDSLTRPVAQSLYENRPAGEELPSEHYWFAAQRQLGM